MVRIDVRHEGISRAIDPFTDNATVLLLTFRVLVGNVALQRRLRAQHLATQLAREQFLGRTAWNIYTYIQIVQYNRYMVGYMGVGVSKCIILTGHFHQ